MDAIDWSKVDISFLLLKKIRRLTRGKFPRKKKKKKRKRYNTVEDDRQLQNKETVAFCVYYNNVNCFSDARAFHSLITFN